jgi:hypothetical protein
MFRRISLCLVIFSLCTFLPAETLFAGITNGDFSQGSYGWHSEDDLFNNINFPGVSAQIQKTEGWVTFLQQDAITGAGNLEFDLKYEFGDFTETIWFNAIILNRSNIVSDPGFTFYSISTEVDRTSTPPYKSFEHYPSVVNVEGLDQNGQYVLDEDLRYWSIRHISVPVDGGWGSFSLRFEVTDFDGDPIGAIATINNVELTTVPEPATMTLGLIGMSMVAAARRKNRGI